MTTAKRQTVTNNGRAPRKVVVKRPRPKTAPTVDGFLAELTPENADLLGEVALFIHRYVVVTPAQLLAVSLWVVHAHTVEAAEQTPYLTITSPEKQCGKTRLMEVLAEITPRAWSTIQPSEAVVFRKIAKVMPTLLLDEVDAIFNVRSADKHEGLRSLLNAGNRRGTTVPRCIGTSQKFVEFSVFCAKALAGIGTLPETITDRSIPIRMKRRTRDELIQRWRIRDVEAEADDLRERLAAWGEEWEDRLAKARPKSLDELSDRMNDSCEPLFAIADRFGGSWRRLAREALVELCTGERLDDHTSQRLRLLADIRDIFEKAKDPRSMTTAKLLAALWQIPEAPWRSWYGRVLEDRDLAGMLRPYDIRSVNLKMKDADGVVHVRKGYRRDSLYEAWTTYAHE